MAISTKSSIFDIWQGSEYPSGDAIVKKTQNPLKMIIFTSASK